MHIVLVSACERRAVKRTRAVLDSYAIRTGERSWATPITLEGMRELRGLLRASATRQTAVACYRNEGFERMRLLWVVGSRDAFGPDGHYPAGFTQRKRRLLPPWLRLASLLAHAGGLAHDLGKAGNLFADKLARAVAPGAARHEADPIRHEWISLHLLQILRERRDWNAAWKRISIPNRMRECGDLDGDGIVSAHHALSYLVATHHRLFGPADPKKLSQPTAERHVTDQHRARELRSAGELPPSLMENLFKRLERLERKAGERSPAFWRGLATISRAALILADHAVSSARFGANGEGSAPYANTHDGRYDQPLDWHLLRVGERAADYAYRIGTLSLPGLATESAEQILTPADESGRFAWQNHAVAAIEGFRQQTGDTVLVFNLAATGAGKTIANAKLACALSRRPRFAIALNLRSLTLQTGDALRDELGLGIDELATVIGDRVVTKLHAAATPPLGHEGTFEVDGLATEYDAMGGEIDLPEWMDVLIRRRPQLRSIIGAPVLVSTIDYLVNAGDPGRQAHHVAALLRLADSDLVLDEIDAYEPSALVAVLRLIQAAALMGRNVVCSSATLAQPLAEAVRRAFMSGVAMRCALEEREPACGIAIVDDRTMPEMFSSADDFAQRYRQHVERLLEVSRPVVRRAFIQPVGDRDVDVWRQAVLAAVVRLHAAHRWPTDVDGRSISFGLVRVANIRTAIALAVFLANELPEARVACYHANDFRIQRHLKERRLDVLLKRKQGNAHILADPDIRALLAASRAENVPFIVVATPVEEIGRDHDFDWAVIEPSSAHSIVQTAGRVNRHRLVPVSEANVAILQYNARWAGGGVGESVFRRPGLESEGSEWRYASADLAVLLEDADLDTLDARLRLGEGRMAKDEDRIVSGRLKEPLRMLCAEEGHPSEWMTQGFHLRYRMRDEEPRRSWWAVARNEHWIFEAQSLDRGDDPARMKRDVDVCPAPPNAWLSWSLDELAEACDEAGIERDAGLEVQLRHSDENATPKWYGAFGFSVE